MMCLKEKFQSTYLYKVRPVLIVTILTTIMFQSTYLYKVRLLQNTKWRMLYCFNPRTYIRYDRSGRGARLRWVCFNPRTYIRYDINNLRFELFKRRFNPRTYIRYDKGEFSSYSLGKVSIHVPI